MSLTALSSRPSCNRRQFRCAYGACIPKLSTCNGLLNCHDGSDETADECRTKRCRSVQFQCAYGGCIDKVTAESDSTVPAVDPRACFLSVNGRGKLSFFVDDHSLGVVPILDLTCPLDCRGRLATAKPTAATPRTRTAPCAGRGTTSSPRLCRPS